MKVLLVKRSICPCGYPTVTDNVPTGKEYDLDETTIRTGQYYCGRCKTWSKVPIIRDRNSPGWLPLGLFDAPEEAPESG